MKLPITEGVTFTEMRNWYLTTSIPKIRKLLAQLEEDNSMLSELNTLALIASSFEDNLVPLSNQIFSMVLLGRGVTDKRAIDLSATFESAVQLSGL